MLQGVELAWLLEKELHPPPSGTIYLVCYGIVVHSDFSQEIGLSDFI